MENKKVTSNEQNQKQLNQAERTKRTRPGATFDYRPLEQIYAQLEFYTRSCSLRRFQYERLKRPEIYVQYLELQEEVKRLQDILQKVLRCPKHGIGIKASQKKLD